MKYFHERAGSAECDVNAIGRSFLPGDDWSVGEFSAATDLTGDELMKVEAVMIIARGARDSDGKRVHFRIPVPIAIAIMKMTASPDWSEFAFDQMRKSI